MEVQNLHWIVRKILLLMLSSKSKYNSGKFKDDVEALVKYIGEEHFISGLGIEVTLGELLAVIPRKRRRCEAYNSLVKYLREERNILLTIKTNKKNGKE